MKVPTFYIGRPNDEAIVFSVGETEIATLTHDASGWGGMQTAEDMFMEIATAIGAEVWERLGPRPDHPMYQRQIWPRQ